MTQDNQTQPPITDEMQSKMVTRAKALIDTMSQGDFRNAGSHFDSNMTSLMPAAKIEELWTAIVAKVGKLEHTVSTRNASVQGKHVIVVVSKFDKATIDLSVTFDAAGNISGIHVAPDPVPVKTEAAGTHAPADASK